MKQTEQPHLRRQNGLFRAALMNEMITTIPMQAGERVRLAGADLASSDVSVGGFAIVDNR